MMLNVKGRQAYYSGPEHHEAGHFVEERTSASVLMQHKTEKASQRGDKCADSSSLGARMSAEPYYAKKKEKILCQENKLINHTRGTLVFFRLRYSKRYVKDGVLVH